MIVDNFVSVKYTKLVTTVVTYDTGISDWTGLDSIYKDDIFRDKVICKIDVTYYLNRYFSEDTIKKYRPVLMMIAKGQITDPEQFCNIIKELIKFDNVFANQIRHIFNSCPENGNFGYYLIQSIADLFKNAEDDYRNFFRGRPEVVICVSDGYLYFSFKDSIEGPLLPDKVECEVLSYGKSWRGTFRYAER